MSVNLFPWMHACTLVTLNYIALKVRFRVEAFEKIAAPLLTGLASVIMLLIPEENGYLLMSLSCAPVIMAGLRYGMTVSLLSTSIPLLYLFILGQLPDFFFHGVNCFLLPAVVSGFLNRREEQEGFAPIPWVKGLYICVLLFLLRMPLGFMYPMISSLDYVFRNVLTLLVSLITMMILIGMYNSECSTWLMQRKLELQANQDALTRLPNLRSFFETAGKTALQQRISVLMVDIDNFKNYNDQLGHLQGDDLLQQVGNVLRGAIGVRDYIARYGGEEFIIMGHSSMPEELAEMAEKIRAAVAGYPFPFREVQDDARISVSIGISTASIVNMDLRKLISEADEALYESKNRGKNRYTFYRDISFPPNRQA